LQHQKQQPEYIEVSDEQKLTFIEQKQTPEGFGTYKKRSYTGKQGNKSPFVAQPLKTAGVNKNSQELTMPNVGSGVQAYGGQQYLGQPREQTFTSLLSDKSKKSWWVQQQLQQEIKKASGCLDDGDLDSSDDSGDDEDNAYLFKKYI